MKASFALKYWCFVLRARGDGRDGSRRQVEGSDGARAHKTRQAGFQRGQCPMWQPEYRDLRCLRLLDAERAPQV